MSTLSMSGLRELVVLQSAVRVADVTQDIDIANTEWRGLHVIVDLTAFTTAASLQVNIQGRDPASGKVYTLLQSAVITAISTVVLKVGPDLTPVANLAVNDYVPQSLRVFADHGNANSHTYSIGLVLCP